MCLMISIEDISDMLHNNRALSDLLQTIKFWPQNDSPSSHVHEKCLNFLG